MNKTVYLFRHGHADSPRDAQGNVLIYGPEQPLSAKGQAQSDALGEWLMCQKITFRRLYTTPTTRWLQTARIIASKLGIPLMENVVENEGLRATHTPYYDGRPASILLADGGTVYSTPRPGNETEIESADRIERTFHQIVTEDTEQVIGIVTHNEEISLLAKRKGIDIPSVPNCSVLRLKIDEREEIVKAEIINPFLPEGEQIRPVYERIPPRGKERLL